MNKIVIVGHPLSGYQEVENLLNACGMAAAQPSRREGFMPDQISSTLCKVHSTPPLTALACEDLIQQIEAGPVWHGMALDLMLGNLEQPIWGWADPQSIYLLNYWRDLDPSITFILVYDRPHSVLTQASADDAVGLSAEALAGRARNWAAYNAAMLHFYLRNPQRCLLVHSQQVREAAGSYLQQVRARINAPWPERMQELAALEAPQDLEATPSELIADQAPVQAPIQAASPQNALPLFLAEALLQQQPASLQLYQELQAVANLPLAGGADVVVNEHSALDAWLAMAANQQRLSHTETLAQQKQQLIERLSQAQEQAADRTAQNEQLQKQLAAQTQLTKDQAAQITQASSKVPADNPELQEENELLLLQLHQVQEELERYYLENQKLKLNPSAPAKPTAPAKPQKATHYGAADRIKRQLSYRLGARMIEQSRSFGGWLTMPSALLTETRQFRRDQEARGNVKLPPIHTYADAHEADRVKQHLSYRLGSTMISHVRTPIGWVKMPFALRREVKEHKKLKHG